MSYFIMQVLPYITAAVFTLGIVYRLGRWLAARIVHNITLGPFPDGRLKLLKTWGAEIVFFRSILTSDFSLWLGGWFMHAALFAVLGGHLVGIYFLGRQFVYFGTSANISEYLSALLGISCGMVMFTGLVYLLGRRLFISKVKETSGLADYLHLVLLLTIVTIGNLMRVFEPQLGIEYGPVRDYVVHLVSLQPLPPGHEVLTRPFFVLHILFVQVLAMTFPFSKLLHLFGMFGERWIINRIYRDPVPGLPGVGSAAGVEATRGGAHGKEGITCANV